MCSERLANALHRWHDLPYPPIQPTGQRCGERGFQLLRSLAQPNSVGTDGRKLGRSGGRILWHRIPPSSTTRLSYSKVMPVR
jgi:hypothetical protein